MLVQREEFLSAVARVKPALSSGGVIQELSHIWFAKKSVFAYDGGFGIQLAHETELDCGVPGSAFLALLNTSTLKEVGLELSNPGLQVKFGKSKTNLVTLDYDRFKAVWPFPHKLPKTAKATKVDETFIEALRKTLFVKASPATRVEHHGVMVQKRGNDLELYASDSATMVSTRVEGAGKGATFDKTLLPRDFAEQLAAQTPEGVDLYVLDDCLIADGQGVSFYSNVLDISTADDMGAIISSHAGRHAGPVPLPAGLEGALSRAEILAGRDAPAVTVSVAKNTLNLSGDYALGVLRDSLELEGEHPDGSLRIKAGMLRRALPYAEKMSVTADSLFLYGEPGFQYLMAPL